MSANGFWEPHIILVLNVSSQRQLFTREMRLPLNCLLTVRHSWMKPSAGLRLQRLYAGLYLMVGRAPPRSVPSRYRTAMMIFGTSFRSRRRTHIFWLVIPRLMAKKPCDLDWSPFIILLSSLGCTQSGSLLPSPHSLT